MAEHRWPPVVDRPHLVSGQKLAEARGRAGLTQEQLAMACGAVRETVGKWETGANMPTPENLQSAAAALKVDPKTFLVAISPVKVRQALDRRFPATPDGNLHSREQQLATALKTDRLVLSSLLAGTASVYPVKLERLAKSLGVPPDTLLWMTESVLDCTRLKSLLGGKDWKAADFETYRLICLSANCLCDSGLKAAEIDSFPNSVIRELDECWATASNGKFGFGTQKRIMDRCSGNAVEFADKIGWRSSAGFWRPYLYLSWSDTAPEGHLPVGSPAGLVHLKEEADRLEMDEIDLAAKFAVSLSYFAGEMGLQPVNEENRQFLERVRVGAQELFNIFSGEVAGRSDKALQSVLGIIAAELSEVNAPKLSQYGMGLLWIQPRVRLLTQMR